MGWNSGVKPGNLIMFTLSKIRLLRINKIKVVNFIGMGDSLNICWRVRRLHGAACREGAGWSNCWWRLHSAGERISRQEKEAGRGWREAGLGYTRSSPVAHQQHNTTQAPLRQKLRPGGANPRQLPFTSSHNVTKWTFKRVKICVFENKEEILLFYFPGSCCLTLFSMFVYRLSRTAPKLLFLLEIRTFINNTLLLHNTLHRFSLPTLLLSENWSR